MYEILNEHFVNVSSEQDMLKYAEEVFELIEKTYKPVGGHSGFKTVYDLLDSDFWKLVRRNRKIVAASIYKTSNGRKGIAMANDGSRLGKLEILKLLRDDLKMKRSWSEVSGPAAKSIIAVGFPPISNLYSEEILKKPILAKHGRFKYDREINGTVHTKVLVGFAGNNSYEISDFTLEEVLFD